MANDESFVARPTVWFEVNPNSFTAQKVISADDEPPSFLSAQLIQTMASDQPRSALAEIKFQEPTSSQQSPDRKLSADNLNDALPAMVEVPVTTAQRPSFAPRLVQWKAANLRYRRPYFEEVMLERHGLSYGPALQPALSAGRFFVTAAFLPGIRYFRHENDLFDHRAFGNAGTPLDHTHAIDPTFVPVESPALTETPANPPTMPPYTSQRLEAIPFIQPRTTAIESTSEPTLDYTSEGFWSDDQ